MNDKRANLLNVREVRGVMVADPLAPSGLVGADWSDLIEMRAVSSDGNADFWTYTGVASVVDNPYTVRDAWGEFTETIRAGAFTKTLSENPQVIFNYMHINDTVMASTRGGGLTLSADPHLSVGALVPKDDTDAQRVMPKVARGDAVSMSFAFRVTGQIWNEDYTDRQITEVSLHGGDVAVIVTGLGANPPAWGSVRSLDLDTDQVLAWLALKDEETRAVFAAALQPAPEITVPNPDEVRAWQAIKDRINERARAERDRCAGIAPFAA